VATGGCSYSEVKSTTKMLETSPSKTQASSTLEGTKGNMKGNKREGSNGKKGGTMGKTQMGQM
jgi:hypothetical protein